jgi:hypothetical protein
MSMPEVTGGGERTGVGTTTPVGSFRCGFPLGLVAFAILFNLN